MSLSHGGIDGVSTAGPGSAAVRHRLAEVLDQRIAAGSRPGHRADGHRVALAIEGGGMRGTVSAGMALAVQELGLLPAFDAVYGASAGAISSTWLLSSRPAGLRGWTDPAFAKALIRRRNVLLGRPMVDVRQLVEVVYRQVFPLDFASVLANPIELHPLATDVVTGDAVDLHGRLTDEATLRLAMRASAALPLLAGGPVEIGGRRYYDAGVAESIPFRQALRDGATHVLVLRSRRRIDGEGDGTGDGTGDDAAGAGIRPGIGPGVASTAETGRPSRGARLVAAVGLRSAGPGFRATFLARDARLAADDRLLAAHDRDADPAGPAIMSIRPPDDSPRVGRLESDGGLLHDVFEIGRTAARVRLAPV